MDKLISMISVVMYKNTSFWTQFGGLKLIAIIMALAVAYIDGITMADIVSPRMVMKFQAENPGMTAEMARMQGHIHVQNVAMVIVFAMGYVALMFRLTPSKSGNTILATAGFWIGILLAAIGVIGTAMTIAEANKGLSLLAVFSTGHNITQLLFAASVSCIPTLIIEAIASHLAVESKDKIAENNAEISEKYAKKAKDELTADNTPRKRATIINLNQPIKTGTNDV